MNADMACHSFAEHCGGVGFSKGFIDDLKGVRGKGTGGQLDHLTIPTNRWAQEIDTGMDDRHGNGGVPKKTIQRYARSRQGSFIGFVTDVQHIAEIHNPCCISLLKPNGAVIGKGHCQGPQSLAFIHEIGTTCAQNFGREKDQTIDRNCTEQKSRGQ